MSTAVVVTETGYEGTWVVALYSTMELADAAVVAIRDAEAADGKSAWQRRHFDLDEFEIRTDLTEDL